MKKVIVLFLIIFITSIAFYYGFSSKPLKSDSKKIQVVTTLFPLYDFAKNIGQDKVEVTLLLPPGVEPHSFEPKPSDILRIDQSDIFIYTGEFMEPWAGDIINGITSKEIMVVNSSEGITLINSMFHDDDEPVGSMDPHIWLDFENAKHMIQNITQSLIERDPDNKDFYVLNSTKYQDELTALDIKYRDTLSNCQTNEIIYGGHYAFGYLSKRYDLKYLAAQGVSPDAEPTVQDLVRLVEQIRKDNIEYIFYEELSSNKIAETIAGETNAKMLLLSASHNLSKEDFERGVSFISILNSNLDNLKKGLQCL